MTAQVVLSDITPGAEVQAGNLFQGLTFYISHKVPQRSRFVNDVRSNGGEVLPVEKHADIKIVDHARKEALPGTYSYRYIEKSMRNGILEDLEDHRVGPAEGTVRSVGSTIQPPKGTRNKYTQNDDGILWDWVVHQMPQTGGGTDGNVIYKKLEAKHPQHPWQSWRDRWIKQLKGKPPPSPLPENAPLTPPSDDPAAPNAPNAPNAQAVAEHFEEPTRAAPRPKSPVKEATKIQPRKAVAVSSPPGLKAKKARADNEQASDSFDEEDAEELMINGANILDIHPANVTVAWEAWARDRSTGHSVHTARNWQAFWEQNVRPRYLRRLAKQSTHGTEETPTASRTQISTPSKKIKITTQSLSSPLTEKGSNAGMGKKSPSYHPQSPSVQLLSPSLYKETTAEATNEYAGIPPSPQNASPVRMRSPIEQNSKRKQVFAEEEVPSSSPPGQAPSPKRKRPNGSERIREVASTPDLTPVRSGMRPESPHSIRDDSELDDEGYLQESPLGKQASETLSELGHRINDTQAVLANASQQSDLDIPQLDSDRDDRDAFLREPTQQVDFDVPPPVNGWDDEDSGAEASSESESTATELHDLRPAILETQAILRGKTPAVDFDVPDPEGGWDQVLPSWPPPMPSSPDTENGISDVDAQTEAWINGQVARGTSVDHVITVWKATSMDTDLAEEVLKSVGKDAEMPREKKGVWTETDDEDLGATDARKIQRLESKHGKDGLTARWEFLNFYKSA